MKRAIFPPSIHDKRKVIEFLDHQVSKTKCDSHYQFLKKTKDAGDAAWGVTILGFATFSMSEIPIAQLFLIVFGLYIVIYAYRAERILDAFHQSHPENISESDLNAFTEESSTTRRNEA